MRLSVVVLVLPLACGTSPTSDCDDDGCAGTATGPAATTGAGPGGDPSTAAPGTTAGASDGADASGDPATTAAPDTGTTAMPGTDDGPIDDTGAQLDLGGTSSGRGTYCTDFPLTEDPISEGGAWTAISSPWLRVRTVDGIAKADGYVTNYNDNYAHLQDFGPDVEITATVYIDGPAPYGEILLLARMADTADTNRGYEFLYDGDGNVQLMRWNGAEGDFTAMGGESNQPGPLQDFDQLRLRVEGDTITAWHRRPPGDWVEVGQTTDDTWADGQPGMGFFVRDLGQTIDAIGLRDYCVEAV